MGGVARTASIGTRPCEGWWQLQARGGTSAHLRRKASRGTRRISVVPSHALPLEASAAAGGRTESTSHPRQSHPISAEHERYAPAFFQWP
eukprot:1722096-Prymnesium_polylepis.1